jgi:hypothetical protein
MFSYIEIRLNFSSLSTIIKQCLDAVSSTVLGISTRQVLNAQGTRVDKVAGHFEQILFS